MKSHNKYRPQLVILGKKIKYHRNLIDIKPKEMANLLEVQPNSYYKIESGETDLSYTCLIHISELLQVDLPALII